MSNDAQKNEGIKDVICRSFSGCDGIDVVRMNTIDEENHTAEFVIGTENPVIDNPWDYPNALSMKGVILKDYRKNPVILADHDASVLNTIGLSTDVRVERINDKNLLVAKGNFDVDDELSNRVWGKVKRGFIRATSLRFRRKTVRTIEKGKVDQAMGLEGPVNIITQWSLVEWSIVAIGKDTESLGRAELHSDNPGAGVNENTVDGNSNNGKKIFILPPLNVKGFRL